MTLGRYVASDQVNFARSVNPIQTSVNSATRPWTDLNGDFVPQAQELGALSNSNFGQLAITTHYDDAVRAGRGRRGYNWETSGGVQHELLPNMSVDVSYYRRWFGNFTITDNLDLTPSDYNPFCITTPVDVRLPAGGGQQLCGLYDITQAKFGVSRNNVITFAENFGKRSQIYTGLDLTMNARLPNGGLLAGGMNVGRTETDQCFVVDSPEQLLFCNVKPPFQPQVKFLGTYPLPWWGLQAAATFQSLAGAPITAGYTATNAQIVPSLGRNLSAGAAGTKTVQLIAPGTIFGDRINQVDLRGSKVVQAGRIRIQTNVDLYNLLNASPVLVLNTVYGPKWQQPTYVLPGRVLKFGVQVNF